MNTIEMSEEVRLRLKVAQLEFNLAHERANRAAQDAMKARDAVMVGEFQKLATEADINEYIIDIEGGKFTLREPVEEDKNCGGLMETEDTDV